MAPQLTHDAKRNRYSNTKGLRNTHGSSTSGQGFANLKKSRVLKRYNRSILKHKTNKIKAKEVVPLAFDSLRHEINHIKTEDSTASPSSEVATKEKKAVSAFQKVAKDFKNKKIEKEIKIKEFEEIKQKKESELSKKRKDRKVLSKKMTAKTKRGQPLMSNQMDLLLNKIKASS